MGLPKVSVIIPAYNRANTIGAAITSVLRQTEPNFELLVVDDASTDHTKDIVREFRDTRVELIEHTQNGGSSVARNTGIKAARGRYVALLDSDDLWFPRMLESQLERLKAAPKEVGGIVSDHVYTDEARHPRFVRRNSTSSRSPDELILIGHGVGMGSSLVAPKEVFGHVGDYDPRYPRAQDWEWLLRFRQQNQMLINPEILFAYQQSTYSKPAVVRQCVQQIEEQHGPVIAERDGRKPHLQFVAAVDWKLARTEIAERHWADGAQRLLESARASTNELVHYGARLVRDRARVLLGSTKGFDPKDLTP
jgi:glycosyltransferase involved in cell wall biosynthesis